MKLSPLRIINSFNCTLTPKLAKNFMVVVTTVDTIVSQCKEVKRTCPRPHNKLAPDLRTKVSALNLHLLPSESKPTDNYLVL